jgi:hypothetical protein
LGSNFLLNTPFSKTFIPSISSIATDQFSHPQNTPCRSHCSSFSVSYSKTGCVWKVEFHSSSVRK